MKRDNSYLIGNRHAANWGAHLTKCRLCKQPVRANTTTHNRKCRWCGKRYCGAGQKTCSYFCSKDCGNECRQDAIARAKKASHKRCPLCKKLIHKPDRHARQCVKCGKKFCPSLSKQEKFCSFDCFFASGMNRSWNVKTAPERELHRLVPQLKYTGSGRKRLLIDLTQTCWGRRKNPDFIVPTKSGKVRKVVEVFGGMGRMHFRKEAKKLKRAFAEVGIECMVLTEDAIRLSPGPTQVKVQRFMRESNAA